MYKTLLTPKSSPSCLACSCSWMFSISLMLFAAEHKRLGCLPFMRGSFSLSHSSALVGPSMWEQPGMPHSLLPERYSPLPATAQLVGILLIRVVSRGRSSFRSLPLPSPVLPEPSSASSTPGQPLAIPPFSFACQAYSLLIALGSLLSCVTASLGI